MWHLVDSELDGRWIRCKCDLSRQRAQLGTEVRVNESDSGRRCIGLRQRGVVVRCRVSVK